MCKYLTNVLHDVQQWSIILPLFCLITDFAQNYRQLRVTSLALCVCVLLSSSLFTGRAGSVIMAMHVNLLLLLPPFGIAAPLS